MWKNITNLHFDDTRPRNHNDYRFIEFVDHVLRNIASPNVNSLHLSCVSYHHYSTLLIPWLSNALNCNLQILDLTWSAHGRHVNFSPLFARFGSLVELRLRSICIIDISAPTLLPNLKFFSLETAKIFNKSPISKVLLLKFPILETFIVSHCLFINTYTVILDSPFLKIFEILSCDSVNERSKVCKIGVLISFNAGESHIPREQS